MNLWKAIENDVFAGAAMGEAPLPDLPVGGGYSWDDTELDYCEFANHWKLRDQFISNYSFAVPSSNAIDVIAGLGVKLIEFGAGTGFWAALLAQKGCDIVCIERRGGKSENGFCQKLGFWHEVRAVGAEAGLRLMKAETRTPLLVWPPYEKPLATIVAQEVPRGELLIYVGEGSGGCTGDKRFHSLLAERFDEQDMVPIPQFRGIHDELYVYRRKERTVK